MTSIYRRPAHLLAFTFALLATMSCGGSSDITPDPSQNASNDPPALQDNQNVVNTDESDTASSSTTLATPIYAGVLDVSDGQDFDMSNLLELHGLDRIGDVALAADGGTIRLTGEILDADEKVIFSLDSNTGETTLLIKTVKSSTLTLFNRSNDLVAISAGDCDTPAYDSNVPVSLVLNDVVPAGRCIWPAEAPILSDNGNVILFYTYDQNYTTQYAYQTNQLHAYTLDTASLQTWLDPIMSLEQVTVSSRNGAIPDRYTWSLSSDGRLLYTPVWWEGYNDDTATTERYVGGVLWNTSTGESQVQTMTADLRNCESTKKVSCIPPYNYVMSTDGKVQYSELPTNLRTNLPANGNALLRDHTNTVRTVTDAPGQVKLPAMQNSHYLATNHDGSHVFFIGNREEDTLVGYALYQQSDGDAVLIEPALRECPVNATTGETDTSESACKYREHPNSIENRGMSFSSNGKTLLMRSISRITPDFETQSLRSFLLDVETGNLIEIPDGYSVAQHRMSADTKILLGRDSFPHNVLTLVRRP